MRKRYILTEETPIPEFNVDLTTKVYAYIRRIYSSNIGNESAINRFRTTLNCIQELLSYRKNAFNDGPCAKFNRNIPASITMDGVKVNYRIDYDSTNESFYVSIYRIMINFEGLGLRRPNKITENKQHNIMNNTKKRIRLTESQLHRLIKKVLKEQYENEELETKYVVFLDGLEISEGSILYDIEREEAIDNCVYDIEAAKKWYDDAVHMALEYEEDYKEHLYDEPEGPIAYLVTLVKMTKDDDGWWNTERLHSTAVFRNKKDKQAAMQYGLYNGKTLCGKNVAKEYIDNPFDDGLDESIRRAIRRIRR